MFPTLVGTVSVAWLAALLARPRRPTGLDDAPWLVYSRYCGTRDRLVLLALVVTASAFLAGIVSIRHPAAAQATPRTSSCDDVGQPPTCYVMNADHGWNILQRDRDAGGSWRVVSTVPPQRYPYR